MTTQLEQDVDTLNSFLRGELAAIESYEFVRLRFAGQLYQAVLRQIYREHEEALAVLRELVAQRDGEPEASSGSWGYFAAAMTGCARTLGIRATLAALMRGERYLARSYKNALENELLSEECLDLISNQLLPVTQLHLDRLSHMLDSTT